MEDTRFSREALARVRDPEANYLACSRFLARHGVLAECAEIALARAYTGAPRPRYAGWVGAARSTLVARG